jgi:ribosomal protein S18 acetylase RimI-like enzyme
VASVAARAVTIRRARPADADGIAALHADSWRRTYRGMMNDAFLDGEALANRQRVWHERLASAERVETGRQFVAVAEIDEQLVGFVCAYALHDAHGSYIDNLHVRHGYMGRGIGGALMRAAGEWLCGCAPSISVYLWAMEANGNARGFYERLGAVNAGTEMKRDPGGGQAPNCRYVWDTPDKLAGHRQS